MRCHLAQLELTEGAPEGHAEDDHVRLPLNRLVDDCMAGVARLQEVTLHLEVELSGDCLCLGKDRLPRLRLTHELRVERERALHLDDVDDVDAGAGDLCHFAGKLDAVKARLCPIYRDEDRLEADGFFLFGFYCSIVTAKHLITLSPYGLENLSNTTQFYATGK